MAVVFQGVCLSAAAQTQRDPSAAADEVVVLGRGETRQVQTITSQQIEQLPAGTSPLKAIENMPGVNFQSADPYGAYEWSTRITVRGFNQNRMGFTLDGVPLGDMTYGNHNGLHISRAIPTELVDRVVLSQGTGSLATASTSNLGGAIQFFSAGPAREFAVDAAQTLGSDSVRRTFARLDSGELSGGTSLYFAVADQSADKWKGAGEQQVRMYTFKLARPLGMGELTAYYNYSDRAEIDYQDLSKDIVARRGAKWDNWYPDWTAAVAAADTCNASGQNDAIACDDAYWNASGLRKDNLGYVAFSLPFNDSLEWTATVYSHRNDGQGLWGTPYVPTPNGAPISIRTTEYDLAREGIVTALTWKGRKHEINGGLWYEANDFTQARRFYGEPSRLAPTRNFEDFQTDPFLTQWEYDFDTNTVVLHLQDVWSVGEKVRVNYGFRSVHSKNEAATVVGPVKTGTIEADEPFLPQIGVNWAARDNLELFGSVAKNVRAFASSGTSGPFSTTAAGFAAIRDVIKPETAVNYEAGLRFRSPSLEGLLAVYHVDFRDRLLGITQGPGIVGNPAVLANVGSVKTNGVEAAFNWRPMTNVSWFSSIAWNDSEYGDDYTVTNSSGASTVVHVSGKQVTDTPEVLVKSQLSYDNGKFFARAELNHTGERFYTYLNQGRVDAYSLLNVGFGYRFADLGSLDELVLQADVTNATDKTYFSTIDSNGFVTSDPNGTAQTLLLGAPRQFFLSLKARF